MKDIERDSNSPFNHSSLDRDLLKLVKRHDFKPALMFLCALDYHFAGECPKAIDGTLLSLNSEWCNEVKIFPITRYVYHAKHSNENLNSLFRNLVFVPLKVFKEHGVSLKTIAVSSSQGNVVNERLNIYYLPYPNREPFPFEQSWIQERNKDQNDAKYEERLLRLKSSAEQPCIVFGPEMMGNKEIDSLFLNGVRNSDFLIGVAPSYHQRINDMKVNRTLVCVGLDTMTCKLYHSKFQAAYMHGTKEDIDERETADVSLLLIPGFGMVFLCICRDYLSELYSKLIETIQPEVVLVLSYMDGYGKFINQAKRFSNKDIITIVGNACPIACCAKVPPLLVVSDDDTNDYGLLCGENCEELVDCYAKITLEKDTKEEMEKPYYKVNIIWEKRRLTHEERRISYNTDGGTN